MGQVFRAAHEQTGALVALKLLKPEFASDQALIRRLLREARAARTVEHRHLVGLLDVGEAEGRHYLALELVPGLSVAERIDAEGPLAARRHGAHRRRGGRRTRRAAPRRHRAPRRQALERPARRRRRGAAHRLRPGQGPRLLGAHAARADARDDGLPRARAHPRRGTERRHRTSTRSAAWSTRASRGARRSPDAACSASAPATSTRNRPTRARCAPTPRTASARPSATPCARRRPTARRRPRPMLD